MLPSCFDVEKSVKTNTPYIFRSVPNLNIATFFRRGTIFTIVPIVLRHLQTREAIVTLSARRNVTIKQKERFWGKIFFKVDFLVNLTHSRLRKVLKHASQCRNNLLFYGQSSMSELWSVLCSFPD